MNRPQTRASASDTPFCVGDALVPAPCSEREHLYKLPPLRAITCAPDALEPQAKQRVAPTSARWQIVVALLLAPGRETHRLAALLERLPTERRRHECPDDVRRRQWKRA